jgi:hypothetical protein
MAQYNFSVFPQPKPAQVAQQPAGSSLVPGGGSPVASPTASALVPNQQQAPAQSPLTPNRAIQTQPPAVEQSVQELGEEQLNKLDQEYDTIAKDAPGEAELPESESGGRRSKLGRNKQPQLMAAAPPNFGMSQSSAQPAQSTLFNNPMQNQQNLELFKQRSGGGFI